MNSQPESESTDTRSVLGEIIRSYTFRKINTTLHVLPGIFLFISLVMITSWLGIVIRNLPRVEADGLITLEELPYYAFALIQWGLVGLIGFTIASMISIYKALNDSRKHIYESSVVSYYFKGGITVEGLYQYLINSYSRSLLPSPITGLVLCFLTTGVAYPVLLFLAEKHIRDHATIEESAFIKERLTRTYTTSRVLLDIVLIAITLGLYLIYMGYRFSKTFNRHIEIIHSSHPTPPTYSIVHVPEYARDANASLMILIILLGVFIGAFLSSIGFLVGNFFGYIYGFILAYLTTRVSKLGFRRTLIYIFISLYIIGYGGLLNGLLSYEHLAPLLKYYHEYLKDISGVVQENNPLFSTIYIFTNNLVISLSSIVPYAGSIIVSMGVYNAGFILGLITGAGSVSILNSLLVFFYPHALLELLGYAILVSSSGFVLRSPSRFVIYAIFGIMILLLAASIEVLTIMLIS
ncbi:MAG: hypothetical protein QXE81_02905 [Desulfurococcaceae archaeon]